MIPECNIRLDLTLNLQKLPERHPGAGMRLAYEHGAGMIGSVSEGTIARHLGWVRRLIAASTLEAGELVAELGAFAALPEVRGGGGGLAELHSYLMVLALARRRAQGHRLPASSLRGNARPQPGGTTIESGLTVLTLVQYQLSI